MLCSISNIIRAYTETLAKDLSIILELFRAHLDERYVYEILIKPSLSKVPLGMQFGKWTGLWKLFQHSICLLLYELLQWTVSPLYCSIHYVAIEFLCLPLGGWNLSLALLSCEPTMIPKSRSLSHVAKSRFLQKSREASSFMSVITHQLGIKAWTSGDARYTN